MGKAVGFLCALLGGLILIGGFAAYFYAEVIVFLGVTTYPYRDLAIPLIALGVALIMAGPFIYSYRRNTRKIGK